MDLVALIQFKDVNLAIPIPISWNYGLVYGLVVVAIICQAASPEEWIMFRIWIAIHFTWIFWIRYWKARNGCSGCRFILTDRVSQTCHNHLLVERCHSGRLKGLAYVKGGWFVLGVFRCSSRAVCFRMCRILLCGVIGCIGICRTIRLTFSRCSRSLTSSLFSSWSLSFRSRLLTLSSRFLLCHISLRIVCSCRLRFSIGAVDFLCLLFYSLICISHCYLSLPLLSFPVLLFSTCYGSLASWLGSLSLRLILMRLWWI